MTGLQRVSFKKSVKPQPRLSLARGGPRSERYWTDEERAIVTEHYRSGGSAGCLARLGPHRTPSGVYQIARKLGLDTPRGKADYKGEKGRIVAPEGFDDELRTFYQNGNGKKRGECNAFADEHKLPRWWVTKRATKLGLVMPHKKEPRWTAAEDQLIRSVPLHDLDQCAETFREHGFQRSPTAIMVRAKRLDISRRYKETLSATGAARVLGIDSKSVTREILQGDLIATKRKTKRLPQQGGDNWSIKPADLRDYVLKNLARIDLRKVDKFEFVQVVAGQPLEQLTDPRPLIRCPRK